VEKIEKYKTLIDKHLTKPTHISYIKTYIFKCSDLEVKEIINIFVDEGLIMPHLKFKDYYGKV
jgi:hypothetical protein